jgi:heptosyltransferase-2
VRRHGETRNDAIESVVVRGVNWIGDAVLTIPALRQLRRLLPRARITLIMRPWGADLLQDVDFVDELLIYDRRPGSFRSPLEQAREWKRRRFDAAVLFQNAFEAALIAWLARVSVRIGYAGDGRSRLLTHPIPMPSWRNQRHEVYYYLNLISHLERLLPSTSRMPELEPDISLQISDRRRVQALDKLRGLGLAKDQPLVVLCPGSTNSRAKRWPVDRFAALGDRLTETSAAVAILGSSEELDVCREVALQMRCQPLMLAGQTNLGEAAAILSISSLLISNDTGAAHVAASLGCPTMVIFGPTNPATTRPFSPLATIIRHPPDCAPCMLRACPIDHRCMTAISPDEVFETAGALLKAARVEVRV